MKAASICLRGIGTRYRACFTDKRFVITLAVSLAMLIVSMMVNYYAVAYSTVTASNPVTDIILSNVPTYDVDGTFVYGPIIFWLIIAVIMVARPAKAPFVLKSISLFVVIRAGFVVMTHIAPFPTHIIVHPEGFNILQDISTKLASSFFTGDDLFFSGHTGLPFLMALVFWDNKIIRWFCLVSSVFFGAVVLLGHLHYTIDVASAFFITYTIYHLALFLFRNDKALFSS